MTLFSEWLFGGPEYKRSGKNPADIVVINADIITCDSKNPRAEAVAIKDKRFTYVGDTEGVTDFVGPGTKVIDAKGKQVTPGFIDNHCHVMWIGGLTGVMTTDLYKCGSPEELGIFLNKYSDEMPDQPLLMGVGWNYYYLPGGLPDKSMLDELIDNRPVVLMSSGGQSGWANSKAWELMQTRNPEAFNRLSPSPDHPGLFLHFHSFNPMNYLDDNQIPLVQNDMMGAIQRTLDEALSFGVTTMNDVQLYRPFAPTLFDFRQRGGLKDARVRCSFYVDRHDIENEARLIEDLKWWKGLAGESDEHLVLGDSLKFYIDGVPPNRTALMLEPYSDDPSTCGVADWTQENFDRVIEIIDGMKLQACTHGVGDAGIRRVINSYERALKLNGQREARHRVEHCELPTADDQQRMADLGIYAAMQPTHYYGDKASQAALGEERLKRFMPWRSLEKRGIEVSFGSDWCAGPINPVYGLLIAGTRMDYTGDTDRSPEESVELEDAIKHWTIGSAKALMMGKDLGSIEVGKFGDLAIFSENLLKMTSWWFLLTHELDLGAMDDFVDLTMVDGRIVYRKKGGLFDTDDLA